MSDNKPQLYTPEDSFVDARGSPMTADELKAAIAALPPMEPVEPAHTWEFWTWDLRQNILNNDPAEFLTWPGIVGTMFVGNAPYIHHELATLLSGEWAVKCGEILDDPGIGKPDLWTEHTLEANLGAGYIKFTSSGNLIHQYYHLWQWEEKTGKRVKDLDIIVEVGGGYGAMALICHRLGFQGRYIILDLSEFSLLQQYYLSNVGIEGVEFRTKIDKQINCDLLIGLYSLNEMPLHARETIIDLCPSQIRII